MSQEYVLTHMMKLTHLYVSEHIPSTQYNYVRISTMWRVLEYAPQCDRTMWRVSEHAPR